MTRTSICIPVVAAACVGSASPLAVADTAGAAAAPHRGTPPASERVFAVSLSRHADAAPLVAEAGNAGIARLTPALAFTPRNTALAARLDLDRHLIAHVAPGVPVDDARASIAAVIANDTDTGGAPARAHGVHVLNGTVGLEPIPGLGFAASNDEFSLEQFPLKNLAKPGADVDAPGAWRITRGDPGVVVAVLDAGVSITHPDLQGKLVPGGNFLNCSPDAGFCDFENTDDFIYSHGTHIAGIIAANTDNGIGVAGLAPNVRIMPVTVINPFGTGFSPTTANAVIWAADNGADVISISLGFENDDPFLADAVAYAHDSGVVVVASTGNSPDIPINFPARYPEVIAVAATDRNDNPWPNNATGPELDLTAPGVDILSTYHSFIGNQLNTYRELTGTSFAAPYVAATAALLLSRAPALTNDDVRRIINLTATDLGEPGWDGAYGHGRLDAGFALTVLTSGTLADIDGDGHPDYGNFDVNGDGGVDIDDLYDFASNPVDVNADGDINQEDAAFLQQFLRRFTLPILPSAQRR